jgi:HAD superfamily hydrolase (TIGR01509 family)
MLDCDGVLFDSRDANIRFYNDLLRRFGRPPMVEADVDYVHVHTAQQSVAYLFRGDSGGVEAEALRPALDYGPYIDYMVPEPTIHEALGRLKQGHLLAVCTNRTNTIEGVLEHHGVAHYFDLVVSAFDVPRPKPFPDQLVKALSVLSCEPHEAVYVGDSSVDMEAAAAAAVPFIAYRNPGLHAAHHIEFLADLLGLVESGG